MVRLALPSPACSASGVGRMVSISPHPQGGGAYTMFTLWVSPQQRPAGFRWLYSTPFSGLFDRLITVALPRGFDSRYTARPLGGFGTVSLCHPCPRHGPKKVTWLCPLLRLPLASYLPKALIPRRPLARALPAHRLYTLGVRCGLLPSALNGRSAMSRRYSVKADC